MLSGGSIRRRVKASVFCESDVCETFDSHSIHECSRRERGFCLSVSGGLGGSVGIGGERRRRWRRRRGEVD